MLYHLIASCCCLLWLTSYKYTFARTISNTYVLKKSLNHLSYRLQSLWSSFIFLKVFSSSSSLSNCILFLFICTGCGINDGFSRSSKKIFSPGLSSSILCCFWCSNNQEMIKRDRQETEIQKSSLRVFLG